MRQGQPTCAQAWVPGREYRPKLLWSSPGQRHRRLESYLRWAPLQARREEDAERKGGEEGYRRHRR